MTKASQARPPGNNDKVSRICFPHKLNNIVLEGLRTRLEYCTPLKKGFILQSKGGHFLKKFATMLCLAKLFAILFLAALRMAQHGLYTSNLFPTPTIVNAISSSGFVVKLEINILLRLRSSCN